MFRRVTISKASITRTREPRKTLSAAVYFLDTKFKSAYDENPRTKKNSQRSVLRLSVVKYVLSALHVRCNEADVGDDQDVGPSGAEKRRNSDENEGKLTLFRFHPQFGVLLVEIWIAQAPKKSGSTTRFSTRREVRNRGSSLPDAAVWFLFNTSWQSFPLVSYDIASYRAGAPKPLGANDANLSEQRVFETFVRYINTLDTSSKAPHMNPAAPRFNPPAHIYLSNLFLFSSAMIDLQLQAVM
ncbi:hypothetical protein C8J57DRAFT_1221830 [Mycena rebaudengoi]|nr:hypothetical protein C8J57DRAFT_1221830 [Mycena rebaudengoi]